MGHSLLWPWDVTATGQVSVMQIKGSCPTQKESVFLCTFGKVIKDYIFQLTRTKIDFQCKFGYVKPSSTRNMIDEPPQPQWRISFHSLGRRCGHRAVFRDDGFKGFPNVY